MKQIIPEWNEAETGKKPRCQPELFRKITVITITVFVVTSPYNPNKMYGCQIPHHAESLAKQLSVSIQSTTANLEQSQETLFF